MTPPLKNPGYAPVPCTALVLPRGIGFEIDCKPSLIFILLAEIRTRRILRENTDFKQSSSERTAMFITFVENTCHVNYAFLNVDSRIILV